MSATLGTAESNCGWKPDPIDGLISLPTRSELAEVWNAAGEETSTGIPNRTTIAGATLVALIDHVHALESAVEMLRAEVARLKESATR